MPALPPYRLQTLLYVRERKKEAAERHVASCLRALRQEEERLKSMEQELERMVNQRQSRKRTYMEKAMQGSLSTQQVIQENQYIERLKEIEQIHKEAIEGQKAVIKQRQQDVDQARQDLRAANQELKTLERHKEKWLEAVKKAREIQQEEAMDELAQTIYMRGSKKNDA